MYQIFNNKQKNVEIILSNKWKIIDCEDTIMLVNKYNILSNLTELNDFIKTGYTHINLGKDLNKIIINAGTFRDTPLFYTKKNGLLIISDDINNININKKLDIKKLSELLLFKVVLNKHTIIKSIYTLEAGQQVIINNGKYNIYDKYIFNNFPKKNQSESDLKNELWSITNEVYDDVIKCSKNKTIIVPLSGGWDSRFIIAMLKYKNIKNVLCVNYSYKNRGTEHIISEKVANRLGYKWISIDYSISKQNRVYYSDEFNRFFLNSHQYHTAQYIQDYLMNKYLLKKFPDKDMVIFTGLSGDMIAGGHFNEKTCRISSIYALISEIQDFHMETDSKDIRNVLKPILYETIKKYMKYSKYLKNFELKEIFDWRERQSKFASNSLRSHEHLKTEWYNPFYDLRFFKFWSNIDYKYKLNEQFYINFLNDKLFEHYQIDVEIERKKRAKLSKRYSYYSLPYVYWRYYKHKLLSYGANVFNYSKSYSPNRLGFDETFKSFLQKYEKRYQKESIILNKFNEKYNLKYMGRPNLYITNATGLILLNKIKNTRELTCC